MTADLARSGGLLEYSVTGAGALAVPAPAGGERADGLWRTTCFELFVKPAGGAGYFEFNFSPSSQWAAYRFEGYRSGMTELLVLAPVIEPIEDGARVTVDLSGLPAGDWRVGVTAVIEERDGTKSYWASVASAREARFPR